MLSHSIVSNSLPLHRLQPTRLLCPWDFPSKNTRVGCHFLFQGIFPTQGSNPHLLALTGRFFKNLTKFMPITINYEFSCQVWKNKIQVDIIYIRHIKHNTKITTTTTKKQQMLSTYYRPAKGLSTLHVLTQSVLPITFQRDAQLSSCILPNATSLEETLMLGKTEGKKRRG